MNQLARNNQVQAARQRLGMRVPGGSDYGNVAGCGGGMDYPQGSLWSPYLANGQVIPQTAPPIDPRYLAGPGTAFVQNIAPLSVIHQVEEVGSPTTIEVSCRRYFYASGISTCNECFQIIINSIFVGGLEYNLLGCSDPGVDAALWNTDECYCPWDIGCINNQTPATISFSAFGTPSTLPFLNMAFWGTAISNMGCMPPYGGFPGGGFPGGGGGGGGFGGPGNVGLPPGYGGGSVP
jgi:hypothetical protein